MHFVARHKLMCKKMRAVERAELSRNTKSKILSRFFHVALGGDVTVKGFVGVPPFSERWLSQCTKSLRCP